MPTDPLESTESSQRETPAETEGTYDITGADRNVDTSDRIVESSARSGADRSVDASDQIIELSARNDHPSVDNAGISTRRYQIWAFAVMIG